MTVSAATTTAWASTQPRPSPLSSPIPANATTTEPATHTAFAVTIDQPT